MFPSRQSPPVRAERASPAAQPAQLQAEIRQALAAGQPLVAEATALLAGGPSDFQATSRVRAALDRCMFRAERLAPLVAPDAAASAAQLVEARAEVQALHTALRQALTQDRAAIEASQQAQAEHQQQLRALAAAVRATLDPALAAQQQAARAELAPAEADVAEARARLHRHEQTPPADRTAAQAWARELGALRDELAGYELLASQAQARAQTAISAYQQALAAAWNARERQAEQAMAQAERDGQAAIAQARTALEAAERAAVASLRAADQARADVRAARQLAG